MSYVLNEEERARLLNVLPLCNGLVKDEVSGRYSGLGVSGTQAAPLYSELLSIINTRLYLSSGEIDQTTIASLKNAALWLDVAIGANTGEGVHSAFIRTYTNRQGQLRLGHSFSEDKMQEASNVVAANLLNNLLYGSAELGAWTVPSIEQIAFLDASAIGRTLYSSNQEDSAFLWNTGWSGTLGFNLLGGQSPFESWRLVASQDSVTQSGQGKTTTSANCLADFRDLIYACDSYDYAMRSIVSAGLAEVAIGILDASMTQSGIPPSDPLHSSLLAQFNICMSSGIWLGFIRDVAAMSPAISREVDVIADVGVQGILDMIAGAYSGECKVNKSSGDFAENARSFFSQFSTQQLSGIRASLLPSDANQVANMALTDVSVRSALAALSFVRVDVTEETASRFALDDGTQEGGDVTERWIKDRASFLSWFMQANDTSGAMDVNGVYRVGASLASMPDTWEFFDEQSGLRLLAAPDRNESHLAYFGGASDDVRTGGTSDDRMYGGDGDDDLAGLEGDDYLEGGSGSDKLAGGEGRDILYGGGENDELTGGANADTLMGGAGSDVYVIALGDGVDTILDSDGAGHIKIGTDVLGDGIRQGSGWVFEAPSKTKYSYFMSTDADGSQTLQIFPQGLNTTGAPTVIYVKNFVSGQLGITLQNPPPAELPPDQMTGDVLVTDFQEPDGNGGTTTTHHFDANGNLVGTPNGQHRPDVLLGNANDNTISGLFGNDSLYGKGGDDTILGDVGHDLIAGGAGKDTIKGEDGDDLIYGDGDVQFDKVPDSTVEAQPDPNAIGTFLYAGIDWVRYQANVSDLPPVSNANPDAITPILAQLNPTRFGTIGRHLIPVVTWGQDFGSDDFIDGGLGNDVIHGETGSDNILAGAGNDRVFGGAGNDVVDGGADHDLILGDGMVYAQFLWVSNDLVGGYYRTTAASETYEDEFGNDRLSGGSGDDYIFGMAGADLIYGEDGNDYLVGDFFEVVNIPVLTGSDAEGNPVGDTSTHFFEAVSYHGNDILDGGLGDDYLIGLAGNDVLMGGGGKDMVLGDGNPDEVQDRYGNDELYGGADNDFLQGSGGDDSLDGGTGDDELWGDEYAGTDGQPVTSWGGAPVNTSSNTQVLDISKHGRDYLYGGDGKDTLTGGGGVDILDGGSGDDLVFGDGIGVTGEYEGADTLRGGLGDDQLQGNGGDDELYGGEGLDKLYGQDGVDSLLGEAGDDYLEGGKGDDSLDGGDGVDTLWGNDDNDTLLGGAGDDLITGGAGNDTITGGVGRDYQDGGEGNDIYVLKAGDGQIVDNTYEMIVDSAGTDTLRFDGVAPAGIIIRQSATAGDIAIQYGANDGIYIKGGLSGAIESVEFAGGATMSFANFLVDRMVDPLSLTAASGGSALAGGKAGDSLTTNTNNTVTGGAGNDVIYVYGSNNTIVMREGDGLDTVNVYQSPTVANRVRFGPGILPSDVQIFPTSGYYSSTLNIRVNGDPGNGLVFAGFNADAPMGFKTVLGYFDFTNEDGTTYTLTYEQMLANGFSYPFTEGADSITASGLDETLHGRGGNDSISAGGGSDVVIGGAGNDSLSGGAGNDLLKGGAGNDYVSGGSGIDTYVFAKGDGVDQIDSFNDAGDKVLLAYEAAQITFRNRDDDLIMTFADSQDQVTVPSYFYGDGTGLSAGLDIVTADGIHLDYATIRSRVLQATAGNDFIIGFGGNDTIVGLAGDDTLAGGAGNDTIDGGAGNDVLALDGGDDTYVFGVGSGRDRIQAVNYVPTYNGVGNDTILMSGLVASQVMATRLSSYMMAIKVLGSDDWIEFSPSNPGFSTLKVKFADGTTWTSADLLARAPLSDGDDVLNLMDTDDQLNMLGGNDTVYANGGNDTIWGATGNDSLQGGGGDDSLYGEDGTDKLSGGDGDDFLDGGAGIDSLDGGAGRDVLYAYTADGAKDTMTGGGGDDVYYISEATDVVVEADGGGYDTIYYVSKGGTYSMPQWVEKAVYNAYGAPIKITGNSLANYFDVQYSTTNDTLVGGSGNDTYYGVSSGDVVTESKTGGVDTIYFKGTSYTTSYSLAGTNIENAILLEPYGNVFFVEAWTVSGTSANNYLGIEGGWGLKAYGYDGNDKIEGCSLYTSYNNIYDYLDGGNGDDILNGRGGIGDKLVGGAGNDTYYIYSTETLVEGANAGTDTVIAYRDYTLMTNFENLTLAEDYSPVLNGTGNAVANRITGNSYDNLLDGGEGVDNLIGGAGNDTLIGGLGVDTMLGGTGDDSYVVDATTEVITELAGEGNDSVQSSVTFTLAAHVDNLSLTGTGAINATGNTLANRLRGNSAANTLTGLAGNDTYLFGRGGGADTIVDSDSTAGNQDVLQLDAGITLDQLWFKHVGTALEISVVGTTDKVTVSNWYGGTANHVEQIQLADGHYLLDSKVEQLVSAMAGMTPPPAGQTTLSDAQRQQLDPVLAATWQTA